MLLYLAELVDRGGSAARTADGSASGGSANSGTPYELLKERLEPPWTTWYSFGRVHG